jgi:clan AA aspartic protease (TIGR02281 family)
MRLPIGIPLIVNEVTVAGPKDSVQVDLILDTGAVLTSLSWTVLKRIGYDPAVTSDRKKIVTANGIIEVPKLQVDSITVGNAIGRNIEVICHDIPELATIRGVLGLNFLKAFRTVIDYKQGYLEIS